MLFNSYQFLIFFPVVTIIFWLLPHKVRWAHLLIASILFYCAFLPVYVLILVITIVIDYFAGLLISKAVGRKRLMWLILSIVANIGFLCFFKYYDFIISNINDWFSSDFSVMKDLWISEQIIHWNNLINLKLNNVFNSNLEILNDLILPIGLSFHTFQAMSYTIEVYRGNYKPERHFGIYALYVMFYPQLVAGPIERPQNILHQFHTTKVFESVNLITGLRLMAWGLFKKVVIADRLAVYVNMVYGQPQEFHWINIAIATVFFAIQIYCDFSGYSDIAIGAARTMGFNLMINFKRPYFASNIKEFWDKWHISLSTWFRDYVYIPLGGNRKGFSMQLVNLGIVFLISGFWHGANWTFIIWGALHAFYSIIFMIWNKYAKRNNINRDSKCWRLTGWLFTTFLVCLAWVFFRAENLQQAGVIFTQLFTLDNSNVFKMILLDPVTNVGFGISSFLIVVIGLCYMFYIENANLSMIEEFNAKPVRDVIFFTVTLVMIILLGTFNTQSFIYFQF